MVSNPRAMTSAQLPPNCKTAISALRNLFAQCTYPDLDISYEADISILRGRRHMAEASLQKLEIELGFRKPPIKRSANRSAPQKGRVTRAVKKSLDVKQTKSLRDSTCSSQRVT